MFDKLKEMFETFSSSKVLSKDASLATLSFRTSISIIKKEILMMLEDLKYREITENDFNEIYATKAGYEITCRLSFENAITHVDYDVYAPTHTGKTRKALRALLFQTKTRLSKYE